MRIALVSDSHLAPSADAFNENWQAIKRYVAGADIDLTIHLGDITLDGFSDRDQHVHARMLARDWPSPLRFLPGNHDIGDHSPAPHLPAEEPLDLALLDRYGTLFGEDHWRLDAVGWRLIGLNAQLLGSNTAAEDAQWEWLAAELAAASRQPLVLLLHKPLFWEDPADDRPHIRYVPLAPRRRLLALLAASDLRLVISGHTHQALDRQLAGVRHVWLPSTAYIFPDERQERLGDKITGLGILELSGGDYRLDFVIPADVRAHVLRLD
jgi:3',5'-cyclic AMP phosphodiesterase CpdA